MRIGRTIIVIFAWALPVAALVLIFVYAKSLSPHPLSLLLSHLYREPPRDTGVRYLSRFSSESDFELWRRRWAKLYPAGKWGRVVFEAGKSYPGIRLTDYSFGPARARDWADYKWLKWDMLPREDQEKPLQLTVKDDAERRYTRAFGLFGGTVSSVAVDLAEMAPWIDLTHVADVHFYVMEPEEDVVVDFKDLRLERGGVEPGEVLGRPFVVLEGLEMPERARLGQTIEIYVSFSVTEHQDIPYQVFLHLFHEKDREVAVPARRSGYIHVEKRPFVPVPRWKVGEVQKVGPFYIHFPTYNPPGRYLVRAGLYNVRAGGKGPRGVPYEGAFDYNGSFPKCRYTDPSIDDFIVGSIVVERD